jgi:hypothetical protein
MGLDRRLCDRRARARTFRESALGAVVLAVVLTEAFEDIFHLHRRPSRGVVTDSLSDLATQGCNIQGNVDSTARILDRALDQKEE